MHTSNNNIKKKIKHCIQINTVGSQFRAQAQQVWGSGLRSPETMNL